MTELEKEESAHIQTIDERDEAEEAVAQIYYLVMGRSAEWSNTFGYQQAIEDIKDALSLLRLTASPDWPPKISAIGLADGEQRHGSTGQLWEARGGQWVRLQAQ